MNRLKSRAASSTRLRLTGSLLLLGVAAGCRAPAESTDVGTLPNRSDIAMDSAKGDARDAGPSNQPTPVEGADRKDLLDCYAYVSGVSAVETAEALREAGIQVEVLASDQIPADDSRPILLMGLLDRKRTREDPEQEVPSMDALRDRRIVAVGWGAMNWVSRLRLQVRAGYCAHGMPDGIVPISPAAVATVKEGAPMLARPLYSLEDRNATFFGLYLGKPARTTDLEVIALFDGDRRYAAAARHGQVSFVGLNTPVQDWSDDLKALVRAMLDE
ncbi:hypothetical protein [Planctomycetes bacterium Poly30]